MHRGYIKIHRKIQDSFIYKDSKALHLWIHLILEANHKDREFIFNNKKQICKRGQLIAGRQSLALETRISSSRVYRILKMLESEHLIEQQKTNKFTIITLLEYRKYQGDIGNVEHQTEQQLNNQRTTTEQPVNTNNNDNTLKNVNNVNTTTAKADKHKSKVEQDFDTFWSVYPKKQDKDYAFTCWKRKKPDLSVVLIALQWQKLSPAWLKDSGKYVTNASTYINRRTYLDENPSQYAKRNKEVKKDSWNEEEFLKVEDRATPEQMAEIKSRLTGIKEVPKKEMRK